jgi:iron complex outermembrane recepter protein
MAPQVPLRLPNYFFLQTLSVRIILFVVCVGSSLAAGQCAYCATWASLSGRVLDPQGSVIINATVTLEGAAPGAARSVKSDSAGQFRIAELPAGSYSLKITAPNFAPFVIAGIVLNPGETRTQTVRLQIETVTETVKVESKQEVNREALDVSEVRESAAKDVGEALERVDGVWKIRKGGIANDVVLRGFQQNNINVLINGTRMYGACPGKMDPPAQHVDFAEVERVDVVKGAFDVRNQGSLGGIINIVNKEPGMGLRIKPTFSTGSFNFYNPAISASYGRDLFKVLGGYSYRESDPYKDGSGHRFTDYVAYNAGALQQHAFDIHTVWLATEFSPAENQSFSLAYTRQQAGLVLYPYLTMDSDYDNADRASVKYSMKELTPSVRALRVEAYLNQVKHFMSDSQRTSAMDDPWTMASHATAYTVGGRVETDLGRDLTLGVESYYRNWNLLGFMRMIMMPDVSQSNPIPDVDTKSLGAFADYRHSLSDTIRVDAGLRYDHASMRVSNPSASTDLYYLYKNTRRTSNMDNYPTANVRMTFALPKSSEFFLGVGTTGRIPDAEERYFARKNMAGVTVGNPLLPVTRNTEFTAGMNIKRGGSYLKPVLFYSMLGDYIVLHNQPLVNTLPSPPGPAAARAYENVDARLYGGEVSYAVSVTNNLSVSGGSSYSRGIRERKPSANILSTNLAEMPPLRAWTAVRYVHKIAFVELGGLAVSRQTSVDADLKETPTAGYGTMNLKLGTTYKKFYATFMVDNLLDKFYYEHLSYYRDPFRSGLRVPEPGRNFFAQVSYTF